MSNEISSAISEVITAEIRGEIQLSAIRTEFRVERAKLQLQQKLFSEQIQQLREIRSLLGSPTPEGDLSDD